MKNLKLSTKKIFTGIIFALLSFVLVFSITTYAASIPKTVASFTTSLASGITDTSTAMTLVSGTDKSGDTLSGYICYTLDEGSSNEEFVCGSTSGTAVTAMIRGIDPVDANLEVTALKKVHRRGASVKITNYPSQGVITRILNGDETFPNPTGYASGVTPLAGGDFADKEYVDSIVNGGTVSYNQVIIAGNAGETVSAGDLIYLKTADAEWYEADAGTTTTSENVLLGIAQGAGTNGNAISGGILISGLDANQTGLTPGTTYYVSNTPGIVSSSAGTNSVTVGIAKSSTELIFKTYFSQQLTDDQILALAGSRGVPGSTNKYVTQDNTDDGTTVGQSQLTQDSQSVVGATSTTGLRNKIAQSFTPDKTKIRGVNLYKATDTGSFTGTVTISIQADSLGSPSGSALATVTITNLEWLAKSTGAFQAIFSSEYQSLTAGSTYWIVIETSTADTSNHPNLGINTAGGYSGGSSKYYNTTDTWVPISTIDFYFSTITGTGAQIISTNSSGKLENTFYDVAEMPQQAYFQEFLTSVLDTITADDLVGVGSSQDGSVMYAFIGSTTAANLYRFERDTNTGYYLQTHKVDPTLSQPSGDGSSIVEIGAYIYVSTNDGTNIIVSRFSKADLTGEQVMTVPVVACTTVATSYTDGVFIYHTSQTATTTTHKWSISGTTMSAVSTATTANLVALSMSSMFDGENVYIVKNTSPTMVIYKLTAVDGSAKTTTTYNFNSTMSDLVSGSFPINIDDNRMYIGFLYQNVLTATAVSNVIRIVPVTKP